MVLTFLLINTVILFLLKDNLLFIIIRKNKFLECHKHFHNFHNMTIFVQFIINMKVEVSGGGGGNSINVDTFEYQFGKNHWWELGLT